MLSNLIDDLKSTSKPSEKIAHILANNSPALTTLLKLTFDPDLKFNVKLDEFDIPPAGDGEIENYVDQIESTLHSCAKEFTPVKNKEKIIAIMKQLNRGSQELLYGVVDKSWHCGLSVRGLLKVFPDLVRTFPVQLANKFSIEKVYEPIYRWSYKLDGVRAIALYQGNKWTLYSRKGKEIVTADHIKEDLEYYRKAHGKTFFDGELYRHGLKFEEIQGKVMRTSAGNAAADLEYHVFVAGDIDRYLNREPQGYTDNILQTDFIRRTFGGNANTQEIKENYIKAVSGGQYEGPLKEAIEAGYEGIMLRSMELDYDFKRSNALLKMKVMDTSEVRVVEVKGGPFPIIENEMQSEIITLLQLTVQQPNGVLCDVGTGFDLPFREFYWQNKGAILGKVVEVLHQGYGNNKRMRFPVFKRIREDK